MKHICQFGSLCCRALDRIWCLETFVLNATVTLILRLEYLRTFLAGNIILERCFRFMQPADKLVAFFFHFPHVKLPRHLIRIDWFTFHFDKHIIMVQKSTWNWCAMHLR